MAAVFLRAEPRAARTAATHARLRGPAAHAGARRGGSRARATAGTPRARVTVKNMGAHPLFGAQQRIYERGDIAKEHKREEVNAPRRLHSSELSAATCGKGTRGGAGRAATCVGTARCSRGRQSRTRRASRPCARAHGRQAWTFGGSCGKGLVSTALVKLTDAARTHRRSQKAQGNGFSPVWMRMWRARPVRVLKLFSQTGHE